jgi:hypothetical protein
MMKRAVKRKKPQKGAEGLTPEAMRLRRILKTVCMAAGVTEAEICGKSRKEPFAAARHVFCFHASANGFTAMETGRMINRGSPSVIYNIRAFRNLSGHFPLMDEIGERMRTFSDTVPVRIDRNTVLYVRREKIEAHGGVENYIKWFAGHRTGKEGDINALLNSYF